MAKGLIPEEIRQFVSYDPETGALIRTQPPHLAGKVAGSLHHQGRWRLTFRNRTYFAHRVAWFLMTGDQPPECIDHIDLNPLNNAWSNLRPATRSQNTANCRAKRSGRKGVTWHGCGKWMAQIKCQGKNHYLGLFETEAEAADAYAVKAKELFGEFARAA